MQKILLYNYISRKKEIFTPLHKGWVGLYTCGPTVYNYQHIGNYRTYIYEDILRRTLEHAKLKVKHVMNITDVGHLASDADEGEDKLETGARREGKNVQEIVKFYTDAFVADTQKLNIKRPAVLTPATAHIKKQIALVKKLFEKGYAYDTSEAVYFDVSKFKGYEKFSRQKLSQTRTGAREEVIIHTQKRNPHDFVLWFKTVGRFERHIMHWPSPWGEGFPGWHLECSAISTNYLSQPFDIHTGGVDHIYPHHTNEIAQSEAVEGKQLARFFLEGEHLLVQGGKMAKSSGTMFTLRDLEEKGFNPSAFRYLVLTAHYRTKLNFTWESLAAAEQSLKRLKDFVLELKDASADAKDRNNTVRAESRTRLAKAVVEFEKAIFSDLDTPKALAVIWKLINEYRKSAEEKKLKIDPKAALMLIYNFDNILGLDLNKIKKEKIPVEIIALAEKRETYRKEKNWTEADKIREELAAKGWEIKDATKGMRIKKI
ncbi:MAG: cysteine--tRNA ligase [Candidatus Sungbacteria bacterium]|nr:cysteine--tRNA ligase [Candidatus Sungbacteria bacterium]